MNSGRFLRYKTQIIFALIGLALLGFGAFEIEQVPLQIENRTIGGACRTPVTVLQYPNQKPQINMIFLHGLSANRRVMQSLGIELAAKGSRVYLFDLAGHGDSTELFSFARAETCAADALGVLARQGEINPDNTILAGHSLGGGIAIRLVDVFPAYATIAISPAPIVLPHRAPSNLLVFSGQFDIPILKRFASQLAEIAGGERGNILDFQERRAFRFVRVPGATHTSLLVDPDVINRIIGWQTEAVHSKSYPRNLPSGEFVFWDIQVYGYHSGLKATAGALVGLLGLLMIFPPAATAITAAFRLGSTGTPACAPSNAMSSEQLFSPATNKSLLEWAVAAFISVCVMTIAVPLHPIIRLYSGDYLASLLLLVAALLWILNWKQFKSTANFDPRSIATALVLGFAAFLAIGAWLNLQLFDAWLNGPRWWRFVILIPLLVPYFFAEETALGSSPELRAARIKRLGFFLALRLILWLACGFAFLATRNDQTIIIILLTIPLAAFSILQRLGADALLRRTGSAPAAAVFDAILAAWFLAAVFPLS